ncbi:MAG: hypothetical protein NW241_18355 [Bacteroidia bacterium]|nr:hypothetical protein [Bacteroidia bacterium]
MSPFELIPDRPFFPGDLRCSGRVRLTEPLRDRWESLDLRIIRYQPVSQSDPVPVFLGGTQLRPAPDASDSELIFSILLPKAPRKPSVPGRLRQVFDHREWAGVCILEAAVHLHSGEILRQSLTLFDPLAF